MAKQMPAIVWSEFQSLAFPADGVLELRRSPFSLFWWRAAATGETSDLIWHMAAPYMPPSDFAFEEDNLLQALGFGPF